MFGRLFEEWTILSELLRSSRLGFDGAAGWLGRAQLPQSGSAQAYAQRRVDSVKVVIPFPPPRPQHGRPLNKIFSREIRSVPGAHNRRHLEMRHGSVECQAAKAGILADTCLALQSVSPCQACKSRGCGSGVVRSESIEAITNASGSSFEAL